MNSALNQQSVVSDQSSVGGNQPQANNPLTANVQPPIINIPPPPPPPMTNDQSPITNPPPHHKFPFMMVTLFLVIVLAGFAGSFLFFSYTNTSSRKVPAKILITPPLFVAPTVIPTKAVANPFATSSSDLSNPFASPTIANPFGTYQNPFPNATPSGNQPYNNPFDKLK